MYSLGYEWRPTSCRGPTDIRSGTSLESWTWTYDSRSVSWGWVSAGPTVSFTLGQSSRSGVYSPVSHKTAHAVTTVTGPIVYQPRSPPNQRLLSPDVFQAESKIASIAAAPQPTRFGGAVVEAQPGGTAGIVAATMLNIANEPVSHEPFRIPMSIVTLVAGDHSITALRGTGGSVLLLHKHTTATLEIGSQTLIDSVTIKANPSNLVANGEVITMSPTQPPQAIITADARTLNVVAIGTDSVMVSDATSTVMLSNGARGVFAGASLSVGSEGLVVVISDTTHALSMVSTSHATASRRTTSRTKSSVTPMDSSRPSTSTDDSSAAVHVTFMAAQVIALLAIVVNLFAILIS